MSSTRRRAIRFLMPRIPLSTRLSNGSSRRNKRGSPRSQVDQVIPSRGGLPLLHGKQHFGPRRYWTCLSLPAPPLRESLPGPPLSVSLPFWPLSWSFPAPPLSVSLPFPPQSTSFPAKPESLSFPPRPTITSAPWVPVI